MYLLKVSQQIKPCFINAKLRAYGFKQRLWEKLLNEYKTEDKSQQNVKWMGDIRIF